MQGLYSDRIQTIVRSRNYSSFDDIAETSLEKELYFRRMRDIGVALLIWMVRDVATATR